MSLARWDERLLHLLRLSWPRWLVTYRDALPAHRQSPIQVLTWQCTAGSQTCDLWSTGQSQVRRPNHYTTKYTCNHTGSISVWMHCCQACNHTGSISVWMHCCQACTLDIRQQHKVVHYRMVSPAMPPFQMFINNVTVMSSWRNAQNQNPYKLYTLDLFIFQKLTE